MERFRFYVIMDDDKINLLNVDSASTFYVNSIIHPTEQDDLFEEK